MSMINIRKTSDTFERYKMPKLLAKIEGRGNGIKTVIVNMVDIARALKRPSLYPTKYFGCELGAQIQVDTRNDRYIVNGAHTAERLQDLLYAFIEKYVLCSGCGNPETQLHINSKKQIITASCIACGHCGAVEAVSRFSSFLIKHPPDQTDSPVTTKRERRGKRSNKAEQNGNGNGNGHEENGNGTPAFASQDSGEHEDDDDDDDWLDEDDEADLRRKEEQQLSEHVRNLIMTEDAEKPESERLDIFYSDCKNLKESGQLTSQPKTVYDRAETLSVRDKAPLLLMNLMVSLKSFQKDLDEVKTLLQLFTYGNIRAQRNLLGGVEKLVANLSENELAQFVPSLLQVLYMSDVVEDQGFFEWNRRSSSRFVGSAAAKRVHAAAKPFMDWLAEADEESDDEEEPDQEEADLAVDFTHNAAKFGTVALETNKKEALDDLDIDNI